MAKNRMMKLNGKESDILASKYISVDGSPEESILLAVQQIATNFRHGGLRRLNTGLALEGEERPS